MRLVAVTLLGGTLFLGTVSRAEAQRPKTYLQVALGTSRARGHDVTFGASTGAAALGIAIGQHEWIELRLGRLSATYTDYVGGFGDEGYNAYGATAYPFDVMVLNERPPVFAGLRPFLGAGLSLIPIQDRSDQCCGFEKSENVASGAVFAGGVRRAIAGGLTGELRGGYRLMLDISQRPGWPVDFTGLTVEAGLQWRW